MTKGDAKRKRCGEIKGVCHDMLLFVLIAHAHGESACTINQRWLHPTMNQRWLHPTCILIKQNYGTVSGSESGSSSRLSLSHSKTLSPKGCSRSHVRACLRPSHPPAQHIVGFQSWWASLLCSLPYSRDSNSRVHVHCYESWWPSLSVHVWTHVRRATTTPSGWMGTSTGALETQIK
jgi:hypothetical protein